MDQPFQPSLLRQLFSFRETLSAFQKDRRKSKPASLNLWPRLLLAIFCLASSLLLGLHLQDQARISGVDDWLKTHSYPASLISTLAKSKGCLEARTMADSTAWSADLVNSSLSPLAPGLWIGGRQATTLALVQTGEAFPTRVFHCDGFSLPDAHWQNLGSTWLAITPLINLLERQNQVLVRHSDTTDARELKY